MNATRGAALILALTLLTAAVPQDTTRVITPEERLYGLSLIWQEATYNFAYFDQVPELDWDAAYREFIPLVLEAENPLEYYRLLQRVAALLERPSRRPQGHPPPSLRNSRARSMAGSRPARTSSTVGSTWMSGWIPTRTSPHRGGLRKLTVPSSNFWRVWLGRWKGRAH